MNPTISVGTPTQKQAYVAPRFLETRGTLFGGVKRSVRRHACPRTSILTTAPEEHYHELNYPQANTREPGPNHQQNLQPLAGALFLGLVGWLSKPGCQDPAFQENPHPSQQPKTQRKPCALFAPRAGGAFRTRSARGSRASLSGPEAAILQWQQRSKAKLCKTHWQLTRWFCGWFACNTFRWHPLRQP